MPLYSYTATSLKGERIKGKESAKDEKELAGVLRERGLMLIAAIDDEKKPRKFSFEFSFGVSLADKLIFVRNLKVMIGAGVSLPRALNVLSEQATNKVFREALGRIEQQVLKGNTLSEAAQEYPKIFSELFTNMLKVGEESGTLENVLSQLALQMEKQHELYSKIKGALIYPVIIITAMLGVGTLMLAVVVPTLAKTFKEFGAELPLSTRIIIGLGEFLSQRWYIVLTALIVCIVVAWRFLHTIAGKQVFDRMLLRAPLISKIVQKTNSAITLRTLSSLIASGVPIVRALEITSRVVGNKEYQITLEYSTALVRKGSRFSETLKFQTRLYPLLVIQMIEVGEETGQTAEVLSKLAEFFEDEVRQISQNLSSIIEPVLMLIIGGAVGFFAISMIQPMYSLLGSIK